MRNWKVLTVLVLAALAALQYSSVPRSLWEYDECWFAMAVEHYQPLLHHPPPPGSPVFLAAAKLFAPFSSSPFHAMLVTSILAVAVGLVAFVFAFREVSGSLPAALVGTAVLYASPAVLVSGTLPQADSGALALFGVAIWACARGNPLVMALASAAAIGWRPQFSVAVLPMFLAAVMLELRTWRDRVNSLTAFTIGCLAWLVPMVVACGGTEGFWKWMAGQAAYYAKHDAHLSRSGYSRGHIALRFLAHPWGPKWLSLPLLFVAATAGVVVARANGLFATRSERLRKLLPLGIGAAAYLAFALATMDPADAVRYAIPGLPFVAVLAGIAITSIPFEALPVAATVGYVAGAYLYALPVIRTRATSIAPPVAAAAWIRTHVPRNAVVLYDMPLRPHAEYLLRGWQVMHTDTGLRRYATDVTVPLVLFIDGESRDAGGVTFRWPDTDAYRKLTRQHYGAVSAVPLPPSERFRVIRDVHAPERTREGKAWRWVGAHGVIELPDSGATHARLTFRTPPEYPFDEIRVRIGEATVTLRRNETKDVTVPLTSQRIEIEPEKTFVPARVPGSNNRDQRTLSVMLTRVQQLAAPAAPPPMPAAPLQRQ